ncbi:MAG: hypothetical protein ACRD0Y_08830 [Terriglobales bacterium]
MAVIAWIIAGAVAGWVTARFMRAGGQPPAMEFVSGIIGGVLGGLVMRFLGTAPGAGMVPSTWVALLGGFVLTLLLRVRGRIAGFAAAAPPSLH